MKPPRRIIKPEWTDVVDMVNEHIQSVADGDVDAETAHDDQHQIFIALIETLFGDGAYEWYQSVLGEAEENRATEADEEDEDDYSTEDNDDN